MGLEYELNKHCVRGVGHILSHDVQVKDIVENEWFVVLEVFLWTFSWS